MTHMQKYCDDGVLGQQVFNLNTDDADLSFCC